MQKKTLFCESNTHISTKNLKIILELKDTPHNRLIKGDVLEKNEHFNFTQIKIIEKYIQKHIWHPDGLFVSSLIECANFNNIFSIYDICLDIIRKRRHFALVASAIHFIFEHQNLHNISSVVDVLENVINNNSYYENCQLIACFCLFRITMNTAYLKKLKDLILNGDCINYAIIQNMIENMEYNNDRYFYFRYDIEKILKICPVCGYNKITVYIYNKDGFSNIKNCPCCGFSFVNNNNNQKLYKNHREQWIINGFQFLKRNRNQQYGTKKSLKGN